MAGREKMRSGMVKLKNSKIAIQERRTMFELQHGCIEEEDGAADGHGGGSLAALGDGRSFTRTARQKKAPQANGTPPASASLGPPQHWQPVDQCPRGSQCPRTKVHLGRQAERFAERTTSSTLGHQDGKVVLESMWIN